MCRMYPGGKLVWIRHGGCYPLKVVNNSNEGIIHMTGSNKQKRMFGSCYCCRSSCRFRHADLGTLNVAVVKAKNEHSS